MPFSRLRWAPNLRGRVPSSPPCPNSGDKGRAPPSPPCPNSGTRSPESVGWQPSRSLSIPWQVGKSAIPHVEPPSRVLVAGRASVRSCWYGSDLGSRIMGLLPHRSWFPPSCGAGSEPVYGTRFPCGLFLSARNPHRTAGPHLFGSSGLERSGREDTPSRARRPLRASGFRNHGSGGLL